MQSACDLSSIFLTESIELCALPPELRKPRWLHVQSMVGEGFAYRILFSECKSISDAQVYVGKELCARLCDIEVCKLFNSSYHLPGFLVFNKDNLLGVVEDVLDNGHQAVYEITYKSQSFSIPVLQEFVTKIDFQTKSIYLSLPDQVLTDLNLCFES